GGAAVSSGERAAGLPARLAAHERDQGAAQGDEQQALSQGFEESEPDLRRGAQRRLPGEPQVGREGHQGDEAQGGEKGAEEEDGDEDDGPQARAEHREADPRGGPDAGAVARQVGLGDPVPATQDEEDAAEGHGAAPADPQGAALPPALGPREGRHHPAEDEEGPTQDVETEEVGEAEEARPVAPRPAEEAPPAEGAEEAGGAGGSGQGLAIAGEEHPVSPGLDIAVEEEGEEPEGERSDEGRGEAGQAPLDPRQEAGEGAAGVGEDVGRREVVAQDDEGEAETDRQEEGEGEAVEPLDEHQLPVGPQAGQATAQAVHGREPHVATRALYS